MTDEEKEKKAAEKETKLAEKQQAKSATAERIDVIALKRAEIALERDQQEIDEWNARKAQKSRENAQRQSQLRTDLIGRKAVSDRCNHRQGGTPKNPYKGSGDTALKVVTMPDGFTELIMCAICKLREWSPHPTDRSPKARKAETATQAKERVELYVANKERFAKLKEQSQNSISVEFTQPMDCGTTFTVIDDEGRQVFGPRPCDTYARV